MKYLRLSLLLLILNSFLCGQCVNFSASGFAINHGFDDMGSKVDASGMTMTGFDNKTASGVWGSSIDLSGMSSVVGIILHGSVNGSVPPSLFSVTLYDSSYNEIQFNGGSLSDLASQGYVTFSVPTNSLAWNDIQEIMISFGGSGEPLDVTFTMLCAYGDENDSDGDGIPNEEDAFPYDPNEWIDTDGDNIGNNADSDDDNDTYSDANDTFPLDPSEWVDTDGDSIGNNADTDDDNDTILDHKEIEIGSDPLSVDTLQSLISIIDDLFSLDDVQDLRPGSTMIEVSGNQATVQLQMEESSDLQTWEDTGTPATMTLPADTDTKFFRFRMAE